MSVNISGYVYTYAYAGVHTRARSRSRSPAASLLFFSLSLDREKDANACAKVLEGYTERAGTGGGFPFSNLCTGAPPLRRDVI